MSGSLPVAVIVDETATLTDSLVSRATALVVRDDAMAHAVGDTAIVWRRDAVTAERHPSLSPFLRQRWRLRLGLPNEFIVEIGTSQPTPTHDDVLTRAALSVCSAAVVRGPHLVTALALSIDNLAVGFALAIYHIQIVLAAVTMGVVSVAMSLVGLELGSRLGSRIEAWSEELGGAVLILVGVAIALGVLG